MNNLMHFETADAGLTLNNSIPVTRQDQVITFVNRNLEPYRNC